MGAYTEIVDFTFTGNETSRTFSGLSITKDDFVKIIVTQVNGSSSGSVLSIFPNTTAGVAGHNSASNYHHQQLDGNGSSVGVGRANNARISFVPGNSTTYNLIYFKLSENNRVNFFSNHTRTLDSSLVLRFFYTTSSGVTFPAAITSLTFTSEVSNGIGTGSRIQIYKLAAEKVADITVASNTTQVDISSLSIDKDSEYLLVSEIIGNSASAHELMVNDNTTSTNYYRQDIQGVATTAAADRGNTALYVFTELNQRTLAYTHIKLSNIGAYTSQSYGNRNIGTSSVRLQNFFGSSTAENITSITKLNIRAAVTSAIGTGSRFILYKLYE